MSALGEIEFVNAIDKKYQIIDSQYNKPTYSLVKGVKAIEYKHLPSSQNQSTTSTEYLVQPQLNQFVSTFPTEEATVNFAFSFSNATGAAIIPFPEGSLCSTFMPLSQATNTLTVNLNGTPFKVTNSEILRIMMSFNKTPELNGHDLVSASQLDAFTDNLAYSAVNNSAFAKQQGALVQPRLDYFSSTYGNDSRFGSVQWVIDNTPVPAAGANVIRNVQMTVREPLFSGVTSLCHEDESNWVGLTSLQIARTFVGNVSARMIRYINQGALTFGANPTWSFVNIPTLYYKLTTLPDDTIIPKSTWYQGYSYDNMSMQAASAAVLAANDVTIQGQTINLSHVPRSIYVGVMVPLSGATLTSSDAPGYQIKGIQVSYAGISSQFASLSSAFEVYKEMSASEGYVKTFTESGFTQYLNSDGAAPPNLTYQNMGLYGTIIRIDASKLSLDWSRYSVGCALNASLAVTVTATNLSANATTPSLFVVPVNDIVYNIADNGCMASKGLLTEDQVMEVRKHHPVIMDANTKIGGNIFKSIWNGLKTAGKYIYKNRDVIIPVVKKLVGVGKPKAAPKRHLKGRGQYETEDEDSEIEDEYEGGSVMSKQEIKRKLKFTN